MPRPRQVAFPVKLFDAVHPDYPKISHRKVEKPWGTFDVVAVYNFGSDMLHEPIALTDLKLCPKAPYLVWEFWNGEYVGRVQGQLVAHVPPRSVKVYRLVKDRSVPALLGTDMHLLMGEMEIADCAWDAVSGTLRGQAVRPAGEKGNVYLHVPETMQVANPQGVWIAKDARDKSLIVRAALDFAQGCAEWSLRVVPLDAAEGAPD